jgi:hypothetical protein
MNTADRAIALAEACQAFEWLGPTTAEDLLGLVTSELGSADALDRSPPHVVAPKTILHVLAGNTPAAALQTLVRGLLLGAHNLAKLPSAGLSEVDAFIQRLPAELAAKVEVARELPQDWLARAEAVIVFGSDETIAHFHSLVRPDQRFAGHGHKVSFGVVFDDPGCQSARAAAIDATMWDQLGCLSPHVFYVQKSARTYGAALADALRQSEPRKPAPLSVANSIRALREDFSFRAANGEPCEVWRSEGSTTWTVLYDETPGFPRTPLHRTIFVKPFPLDFAAELRTVHTHLSCAGIFPSTPENAARVATTGVSRICPIGRMQFPPLTWRQDGEPVLASLVRWVDFEPGENPG